MTVGDPRAGWRGRALRATPHRAGQHAGGRGGGSRCGGSAWRNSGCADPRGRDDRVTGAVVIDPQGQPQHVDAALVIGADGIGSRVARLVEAPVLREARAATAAVYGHWSGLTAEGYHWHYGPAPALASSRRMPGDTASSSPSRRHDSQPASASMPWRDTAHVAELAPALAAEVAAARPESRLWAFAGRQGLPAPAMRAGLGAGRRCRLLQGPADRAWHHRCAARRRTARRGRGDRH